MPAIFSNIENAFSRIDFLKEFTSITREEIDAVKKLIQLNPRKPIIRIDREREPILNAVVKLL